MAAAVNGKRTSSSLDPYNATTSCLENILQVTSISDDAVIIEDEPQMNGQYRRFVKLKKTHWVDPKQRRNCNGCSAGIGPKIKSFNCRRCGEVFCGKCCSYRRRLSPNCEPSADGHYYRVCYNCSDCGTQSFGQTRNLTEYFQSQKGNKRISILREMQRLLQGFKANVKVSRFDSVVADTISTIKVPSWQMSEKWLESKEVDWCGHCSAKFTVFMQKHHCRLCGAVFCHKCCSPDLMLYYDEQGCADWALIRVVGCPDSEPNVCFYLKVCVQCCEDTENMQVRQFYSKKANSEEVKATFGTLSTISEQLRSYQMKINKDLLLYQEMVEGLMDGKGKFKEVSESGQNVVKVFAKLQIDVSDLFSRHAVLLYELKKVKMGSRKEMELLRNISAIHFNYYNSNMSTFKCFKENLNKTLPAIMLREVQDISDKYAINSICITTRRLGLELLYLCTKFSLDHKVPQKISELDDVCTDDLKSYIETLGEDWDEHYECLNLLVKERFNAQKLIAPSQSLIDRKDSVGLALHLKKKCMHVLLQVQEQMLSKSSETKFVISKATLRDVIKNLEN